MNGARRRMGMDPTDTRERGAVSHGLIPREGWRVRRRRMIPVGKGEE